MSFLERFTVSQVLYLFHWFKFPRKVYRISGPCVCFICLLQLGLQDEDTATDTCLNGFLVLLLTSFHTGCRFMRNVCKSKVKEFQPNLTCYPA